MQNPGGVINIDAPKSSECSLCVCVLLFKLLIPAALTHKSYTSHFLDFFPPYSSLFHSFIHVRITAAGLCLRVGILVSASRV